MTHHEKGLIIISGCDTGIGFSLAHIFSRMGYQILVSFVYEDPFPDYPNIKTYKMDLRESIEIEAFVSYAKTILRDGTVLEAVITNSGVAIGGPIENLPDRIYRDSFEINYFGAVAIIQAFIPDLISAHGRIMVIGSLAGKIAMPYMSPYASTKFALKGFCDSLRRELSPFGVKTILIEPSAVATPIWSKAMKQDISFVDQKYMKSLKKFQENFIESGNQGMDTGKASEIIAGKLFKKRPKARYLISQNNFITRILTLLPPFLIDHAVKSMFDMNYGEAPSKDKQP